MINVAIIGCGYWGPNLARNFSQIDTAHLHTICDLDSTQLQKMKSMYPYIHTTTNYEEVLRNPEIHSVVIATPTKFHFSQAKQALLAGKHVLLEKPMTHTAAEARELIDLAKEKGKVLMVDHTFEYHSSILRIKDIIQSGELGDIYYITANWLNLGLLRSDVNVVYDLGTHIFSIVNFLTGKQPESLKATGAAYIREEMEEVATVSVKYPNNILVQINVSWLEPCKQRTMTIVGSKKMLVFDLFNNQESIKIFDQGVDINNALNKISYRTGDIYSPKVVFTEPLRAEALHFVESIKNNTRPLTDGENGLSVVRLLEASQRSIKNNGGEVLL